MRQLLESRLCRLEEALAKKRHVEAMHEQEVRRIAEQFAWPFANSSREKWIVDPFRHWFETTFEPIPDDATDLEYVVKALQALRGAGLFNWLARKAFDAWWRQTFPDTAQPEERYGSSIPLLVSKLRHRIYDEAVGGLVPFDQQCYFLHPDRWIIAHRDDPADNETSEVYFFRLLSRPSGVHLRRARLFAKAWAEVPLNERTTQPWAPVRDNERPLEWLRRTLSERAAAPAA